MFGKYSYFLWQHLNPDQECEYKKCSVAEIMYTLRGNLDLVKNLKQVHYMIG